jgi:hypothetical protein
MKHALIIIALLFMATNLGFASNLDVTCKKVEMVKKRGQTVHALLEDIGVKYKEYSFIDEPPGKLRGIRFDFPDGARLYIYISKFKHAKQFDPDRSWDIEILKREIVSDFKCYRQKKEAL